MCKPPPGPRCANHAAADLAEARDTATTAIRTMNRIKATDSDAQLWAEQSTTRVDLHTATTEARQALRTLEAAQRVYDSTPTGQRELDKAHHAAETAGDTQKATQLLARLTIARADREAVMERWRASSAYTEERLSDLLAEHRDNPGAVADKVRTLRTEIVQRRAAENGVLLPPAHQKARAAWEATEPRGRTWRAVADLVNPAAASLTFADPAVHRAAGKYVADKEAPGGREDLLAAVAKALPASLAAPDDLNHHMYRAKATGKPWSVPAASLAHMVASKGQRRVDESGKAAVDGRPGDQWRIHRVVGPVRITGGTHPVEADAGWVCVRVRDHLWRVLDDQQVSERLHDATAQPTAAAAGTGA